MKKINSFYLSLAAGALLTLGACSKKNENITPRIPLPDYIGFYILNEGAYPGLNSTIGFTEYETGAYTDNVVSGSVGQGANDLVRYGSKVYVSATNSNIVTVIETYSKKILKTIQLTSPRYLLPYRGKIYATNGDNQLTAIDTSSYETSSIEVGRSPEQLTATNGKIYVTNSGWKDVQNGGSYDNRLSVINPSSFSVEKNITVANNINTISADTVKNILYVNAAAIYEGNNIASPSKLYVINTTNDDIKPLNFGAESIDVVGLNDIRQAYLISSNYAEGKSSVLIMDLDNQQVQQFPASNLTAPYSINFINETRFISITDAKDYNGKGTVNLFNFQGQAYEPMEVGIVPKKVVFSHSNEDLNKIVN